MSGFKLLAIRTRNQTKSEKNDFDFLKILKPHTVYKFYHEYTFFHGDKEVDSDQKVTKIEYNRLIPNKLYNQKNLDINISAIVGKNGSGKSTLLELFFVAIYLLSFKYKQIEINEEKLEEYKRKLPLEKNQYNERVKEFNTKKTEISEIFEQLKKQVFAIPNKDIKFFPGFDQLKQKLKEYERIDEEIGEETYISRRQRWIQDTEKEIKNIIKSVDVEIFYELNNTCYLLAINGQKKQYLDFNVIKSNLPKPKTAISDRRDIIINNVSNNDIDLSLHFFYTIAISYSHYGLNALDDGDWLNDLFHKNDAYQTPLVINPMRTDGNIDINKENNLVHQRLLSNLLEPIVEKDSVNLRHLASNKIASKLILKFNEDKFNSYREKHRLNRIDNIDECIAKIYEEYTGSPLITYNEPILEGTRYYLNNKLIRICSIYDRYKGFIKNNKFDNIPLLASYLIKDKSHITFKLKQAMNFMNFKSFSQLEPYKEFEVDIYKLSNTIAKNIEEEKSLGRQKMTIEFLPPPTFDIRIQLEDGSFFETMSSGEKQKIHSIGSIIYHLINLNSASKNGHEDSETKFYRYNYINILFDEVEQYFHPDLQRTFINDLLSSLSRINPLHTDNIHGVNILFATHSPFILSDIPSVNTLRLDEGTPQLTNEETFGANIYDLLEDSFFMKESFVGEYSNQIIQSLINKLRGRKKNKEENLETLQLINIIGEPFLREKLQSMYYEKYPNAYNKEKEIRALQNRLKQIMK